MALDFDKLRESAKGLLSAAVKGNLEIKSPTGDLLKEGNINEFLNNYNETNAEELIGFVNDVVANICSVSQNRAEFILKTGNSDVIDSCEAVNGPNYTVPMNNVVNKVYTMCTSGEYTFTLPNGNSYTPNNLLSNVKLMVRCYLSDEAVKFKNSYKAEPEFFENRLESHLRNYIMGCELQMMRKDIDFWRKFVEDLGFILDDNEFYKLREAAKDFLNKAVELNISIVIDEKHILNSKDVDSFVKYYEKMDYEELIGIINTIIDNIYQWKTLIQKLIDGSYGKNEVKITTYSFEDIFCKNLFSDSKIQECYLNKEKYISNLSSDEELAQKTETILNDLNKFKPDFEYASKAMCRAHKVDFNFNDFEKAFNNAKIIVKRDGIVFERDVIEGLILNFKPRELVNIFTQSFQKSFSLSISRSINSYKA